MWSISLIKKKLGRGSKFHGREIFNSLPLLLVHAIGYQHFIDWKVSCMYKCSKYKCCQFFSSKKKIWRGGVQNITDMKYVHTPHPPHTPHPHPHTHENTKAFSYLIIRPLYLILPFCTRKQILILKVEKRLFPSDPKNGWERAQNIMTISLKIPSSRQKIMGSGVGLKPFKFSWNLDSLLFHLRYIEFW